MLMNTINRILVAALCVAVFSCADDENYTPVPLEINEPSSRISTRKFYHADGSFGLVKFIYDSQGKLQHKDWYNTGNEVDFQEDFIYEAGKLVRIDRVIGEDKFAEVRLSYTKGKISTMEYWMEDNQEKLQKQHTTQYEYQGELLSKTTSVQHDGSPSYYSLYTYVNENITTIKSYSLATHVLSGESRYTYDDKPNPFYKVTDQYLGSPLASSRNNVLQDYTFSASSVPQEQEIRYSYSYNEKGLPTELFLVSNENKQYLDESYTYLE